jgi:hypothetical protein
MQWPQARVAFAHNAALVVVGVLLVVILVITVRRSRVRRRDETPEDRRRRDKLDLERSRAWLRKNRARGEFGSRRWAAGRALRAQASGRPEALPA